MTALEVEKRIIADGWFLVAQVGSHRQYKHPAKLGKVTIPFHRKPKDLDKGTIASIFRQAGIK